jgi:hypothetical protein
MARARIPDPEGLAAVRAARAAQDPAGQEPATEHPVDAHAAGLATPTAPPAAATSAPGLSGGVPRSTLATAVRYSLQLLAERATGNTVEVRVPPFAAVQCIEGPGHTRGTPPNVVEMDAATWLSLATGDLAWELGIQSGRIHASGQRADLRGYVPIAGL